MRSGTYALATQLSGLSGEELRCLLQQREIEGAERVHDLLGLTRALLAPRSLERALAALNRRELGALLLLGAADEGGLPAEAAALLPRLAALGLTACGGGAADVAGPGAGEVAGVVGYVALPEVSDALTSALEHNGVSERELLGGWETTSAGQEQGATPARISETAEAEAAEELPSTWIVGVLTAEAEAQELARVLHGLPVRVSGRGKVLAQGLAQLTSLTSIGEEHLRLLLRLFKRAGYTRMTAARVRGLDGQRYMGLSEEGFWQHLSGMTSFADRWMQRAKTALGELHQAVRGSLERQASELSEGQLARGLGLGSAVAAAYAEFPLLERQAAKGVAEFEQLASYLGMLAGGRLTPATLRLLRGECAGAADALLTALPPEDEPGYIQPDLSFIISSHHGQGSNWQVPELGVPEQLGAAQVRRITPARLRALCRIDPDRAGDEEREEALNKLRELYRHYSRTPLPQPLEFMMREAVYGPAKIVLHDDLDEGRTRVEVRTTELVHRMLGDSLLAHLGLKYASSGICSASEAVTLESDCTLRLVQLALQTAGYEVNSYPVLHESNGFAAPALPDEEQLTPAQAAEKHIRGLLHRLRTAQHSSDSSPTHLLLQLAIADRQPLALTAQVQGREYRFTVVPLALTGGRLRALDTESDSERTLPTASITSITPADSESA